MKQIKESEIFVPNFVGSLDHTFCFGADLEYFPHFHGDGSLCFMLTSMSLNNLLLIQMQLTELQKKNNKSGHNRAMRQAIQYSSGVVQQVIKLED